MCFLNEKTKSSERFPSFSAKGSKVGEKVATACYLQGYFEKEQLYHLRMCQMTASSLSANHTLSSLLQTTGRYFFKDLCRSSIESLSFNILKSCCECSLSEDIGQCDFLLLQVVQCMSCVCRLH